jgi:hypothetical protein
MFAADWYSQSYASLVSSTPVALSKSDVIISLQEAMVM